MAVAEPEPLDLPVQKRRVTDPFFLILFVAFFIALLGLLVATSLSADLNRLIHGTDRYGNVCGKTNKAIADVPLSGQDFTNKPYSEPDTNTTGKVYYNCTEKCSDNYVAIWYRCIPRKLAQVASLVGEVVSKVISDNFFQESAEDIAKCWKEIIYMCLIALGLSLLMVILLRFLACLIIWLSIALALVASIAGTGYLWYLWAKAKKDMENYDKESQEMYKTSVNKWLIYAIISTVATIILLLVILVMRSRIQLVVALFKEAGKVMAAMPQLILQPIWTFIFLVIICSAWIFALLNIESSGKATIYGDNYVTYKKSSVALATRWIHIFALFWFTQFCLACQDFVIGSAVCQWYFRRDKSKLGSPIFSGIGRLLLYHFGSVALGSLLIAILKVIRLIFSYLEKKLKIQQSSGTCRGIVCCIDCCLQCFENFLKCLSRNAYIEIAIFGCSFREGASRAFRIIGNNALRVAAINSVGDFVLFLSKVGVMVVVVVCGVAMIKVKAEIQHVWVPIALCALFALLISHCFLTVYEMSIDTLLVCFCEDCDINDGVSRPYYMDSTLMQFVETAGNKLSRSNSKVGPTPQTTTDVVTQHM
ncbi:hypothetical protein CHUAL_013100 [Chamberlinius hualienensis]